MADALGVLNRAQHTIAEQRTLSFIEEVCKTKTFSSKQIDFQSSPWAENSSNV